MTDTETVMDDSGVYVVIRRVETVETHKGYSGIRVTVRADLMTNVECPTMDGPPYFGKPRLRHDPIMSFSGSANAVRKALIRFINEEHYITYVNDEMPLGLEHASYIGYELLRAELTPNYQQDRKARYGR